MPQPFCQSKAYRDLDVFEIAGLNEDQAHEKFALARWGSTTIMPCPDCGAVDKHYIRRQRRQWRCKHCYRDFSVTTGTPLLNRKLSFRKLLLTMYEIASAPKGCSINALHARLGITCKSAFQNLSKFREALFETADLVPLSGIVQIDCAHFCGKPRRPRKRSKVTSAIVNNRLRNRKANMVPDRKYNSEPWNLEKFKNRRIVLTLCQISQTPGVGAERTISRIVRAESAKEVLPIIRKYVADGATIWSDEGSAFSSLSAWYDHQAVCHSKEYCRDDGVNNNQAESFFSRMRRSEYGVYHGLRPQYLSFYASEAVWYSNMKNKSIGTKFDDLLKRVLSCGVSKAWRGYFQGHRLASEYLG